MREIRKYGLIGYPLSHSFSPTYFKEKFLKENISNTSYLSYPIADIQQIWNILPSDIQGFNVTIPYKEKIIPFLDALDHTAKKIKAVNTVKKENDRWIGYNTDVYGFKETIQRFIGRRKIKEAMVLGNGGAAKAVIYALKNLNIKVHIISRKRGYRGYKNLDRAFICRNKLIINTTPLGMHPHDKKHPDIPYAFIEQKHLLFDLIYNPKKTLFLKRGEENGAFIKNGLEMLHLQAEKSWEIWNSHTKNNNDNVRTRAGEQLG